MTRNLILSLATALALTVNGIATTAHAHTTASEASALSMLPVAVSVAAPAGLLVSGTAVVATVFSAGWVLSAAGRAIAYIPNEVGRALLYNERVTR